MASSLEKLFAEEGFKGKSKAWSRAALGSIAVSVPPYLSEEKHHLGSSSSAFGIGRERGRSDCSQYGLKSELPPRDRVRCRRWRGSLIGNDRTLEGSSRNFKEIERLEGRNSSDYLQEIGSSANRYREDAIQSKRVDQRFKDALGSERFADRSVKEVREIEIGRNRYSKGLGDKDKGRYEERNNKDILEDKRTKNNADNHLLGQLHFSDISRQSLQRPDISYGKSNNISHNSKNFEDIQSTRHLDTEERVFVPALDEVAIKALISILSGHIRHYLKDEYFRISLRRNCSCCLSFNELEEGHHAESKVIAHLEQAMDMVERVAEKSANAKKLKKASLQLNAIAGLNSKELKDGFTSGVPNSHLSACAHLYLGVIYKLQKKDRVSAKHLLQVFCDSPFLARTSLLPELWDYLFLPHLTHLRVWYNQEADSIPDTSSRQKKLKLLEKAYNEVLNTGTHQFAVYYKDWLTEGVEGPALPSIQFPSVSVKLVVDGDSDGNSPELGPGQVDPALPKMMISKKLHTAVFGQSNKLDGLDEVEDGEGEAEFDICARNFDFTVEKDRQRVIFSPEPGTCIGQHIKENSPKTLQVDASHAPNGLLMRDGETRRLDMVTLLEVGEYDITDISLWHTTPRSTHELLMLPHTKANELILEKLAMSVFPLQHNSIDFTATTHISHSKISNMRSHSEGSDGFYEYFNETSFFSSIRKEFLCPLTGCLFEDPVTLETGQTFEREAIKEWFKQGKRVCPVTGRKLDCLLVPSANFVLKRVVDSWKSENCKILLALASQIAAGSVEHGFKSKGEAAIFILENLLNCLNKEEKMTNTTHLISLGGLQFLIRRLESGNLEEKTRVVALLRCCIKADGSSRNYIARNIKKSSLLELLHSKQVKSQTNAVLLLTELICLGRRTEITAFLNDLLKEGIMYTMHVLLVYLQSSPSEQKPLVAVLLLHFDLLVEPRKCSIYREEAIDTITMALDHCLTDRKGQEECCKALLILGGRFSFSGEVSIENWLLRQSGFCDWCEAGSLDKDVESVQIDEDIPWEEEEEAKEIWLRHLAAALLVAWLSHALASFSNTEFQLSVFSTIVPRLKENLEKGERIENRVLSSMSLLNFSKISECRVLLMKIADEIVIPLRSLVEVTWTAKQLHKILSGEDLTT
ncbi:PREDICTED: putative E3 ubiquitin-protein ligase LIN-1 isoform X2 [Nelumbo nucifera]|uniref:RING-type E3 ubiquitin transferase n=1 Tax=Nelumbo nucifera TaxID=4432 RepID=A0A1U8AEG7_NELNU|nr:PREDICTED: putative E3 ubiquitin-protein ligase LIN-1 isoform X2 [Nelumbo nucifera]